MSNVLKNAHAKYHSHTRQTYPQTEAILFRNDTRPPYWRKANTVAFILFINIVWMTVFLQAKTLKMPIIYIKILFILIFITA